MKARLPMHVYLIEAKFEYLNEKSMGRYLCMGHLSRDYGRSTLPVIMSCRLLLQCNIIGMDYQ